jgi:protein gp37
MGEVTNISWCDHTINWWIGCTKVSPACDGCYAEFMMDTRYHRVVWGQPGSGQGTRSRTSKSTWDAPLKWERKAAAEGKRPFVFSSSLSDIFDNHVPVQWRYDAFEVMRKTPNLVYLLLTKRPQNIIKMCEDAGGLPKNCAIGASTEDQKRFDLNTMHLSRAKHAVDPLFTFISIEPQLGMIDPEWPATIYPDGPPMCCSGWECGCHGMPTDPPLIHDIDWVITGGETDQGSHMARVHHPVWTRRIRDACVRWGKSYHHKQNGMFVQVDPLDAGPDDIMIWPDGTIGPGSASLNGGPAAWMRKVGKKESGRLLDGVTHDAFPEPRR